MQNLSDEDIDKLFKRAAEKQQTQFDPADWDNMASRLDANKRPWLNYYTGTGSIVLLGVVIWLGWFSNKSTVTELSSSVSASVSASITKGATSIMDKSVDAFNSSSSTTNTLTSSTEKVENVSVSPSASLEVNSMAPTNRKVEEKVKHDDERNDKSELTGEKSSSTASQSNQAVLTNELQRPAKSSIADSGETPVGVKNENSIFMDSNSNGNEHQVSAAVPLAGAVAVTPGAGLILEKEQIDTDWTSEQNPKQHHASMAGATDSLEKNVAEPEIALENMNFKKGLDDSTSKQTTFSRFAIKATIAPDFSSEQFKSVDKMGFNYGLIAEYFLNKNFSIATGALWSRKFYSAVDVEYNGYHADRAYGDCRMWDIPLNVNYYFTPSKQYSFFATAGFSSYLMNEENYDYEVDTKYGTKTHASQVIKENNEWFKILNVSVGLQRQINSRFTMQVEPFVKVPLAGVGEGNISLASFGGFFSVRYNF